MEYRTLGKTGLKISVVGVGTWQFGGEWGIEYDQGMVDPIFDAARECGINLIDTAECYGDHTSERFIGRAIERDRDRWVLATKFGHKFHGNFDRSEPRGPEDVLLQLEDSLKALRTDYVDLYQYHSWNSTDQFLDLDVRAALEKAVAQGKVRHMGNSIPTAGDSSGQVKASPDYRVEAIQLVYNRLDREPEKTVLPLCVELDLGVLARVPLASGYLSGKYKPGHVFSKGEVRGHWHKDDRRDEQLAEVERIRRDEVPEGVPMAQWALAWVLRHPAVTCTIPGCKNADQVRSNAAAASLVEPGHPQAC